MATIEGQTVTTVREMTDAEHERMGWRPDNLGGPIVLVLADDTVLFPARDTEGNSAGAFHGKGFDSLSDLEGAVIKGLSPMSDEYMDHLNWGDATGIKPTVVRFEDNRAIWPSCDPEGNQFGCLRAYDDQCGPQETFEFEFETV